RSTPSWSSFPAPPWSIFTPPLTIRRFNRYGDRYYQDSRRFKHSKRYFKKLRKQRLRDQRRFRNQRHHVHGPQCWR
ncbi:MAG: hypothetical protein O3A53_10060, partial [Acidobacteria bacterium]|nr:hypothetical protein [Acidobacteriota bacterium]MDA1235133.1 hypothetical protein [Acidobacteriota bacterium]